MAQQTDVRPNLWELSGDGTQVTYSTTSADGEPRLSYSGPKGEHDYSGDEIQAQDTALGTEVTVMLEDVGHEMHTVSLTLLVPEMWIAPHSGQEVRTIGIFADKEEPLTAPVGLPAARELFQVVKLAGEGKQVDF
jgi:hypothetical protein